MTYLKQSLFVAASGLFFIAAANANEGQSPQAATPEAKAEMQVIVQPNTQVLAAISTSPNVIAVRDDAGQLFYNHTVSRDELSPVSETIEVLETYSFEHNGRTYTNRVVSD